MSAPHGLPGWSRHVALCTDGPAALGGEVTAAGELTSREPVSARAA